MCADSSTSDSPSDDSPSIIVEDETLRGGFAQIPYILLTNANLSDGAKIVYGLLLRYSWQKGSCFPGQDRLARDKGCSVRTIQRQLEELAQHKIIVIRQRGLNRTNLYILPKLSAD